MSSTPYSPDIPDNDPAALTVERGALEALRAQLSQTTSSIHEALNQAEALRADMDGVRALVVQLAQDSSSIKDASREALAGSGSAVAAIKDIEVRLGRLTALRELGAQTDEQLAALDALANEVTHKTRALENQKRLLQVEEAALAEPAGTIKAGGRAEHWFSHQSQQPMGTRLPFPVPQQSPWAVRHRTPLLAGVGALVLLGIVSIALTRTLREGGPIGANVVAQPDTLVPEVRTAFDAAPPWTPGTTIASSGAGLPRANAVERRAGDSGLERPAVRARPFSGTLGVRSDPAGARVFINQRPVGTTPLRVPQLPAGTHALRVEREGYERWTAAVMVPANRLTEVDAKLRGDGQPRTGEPIKAP